MKKILATASLAAILGAASLFAADVNVDNVRARTSKPGANNSAIFMNIKNNSDADVKLIEVKSSVCKSTEMHTHKHENGMKSMVQVPDIEIAKKGETKLVPGGLHVMLMELNQPLKEGDKVDLWMKFNNGETITLDNINVTENFK